MVSGRFGRIELGVGARNGVIVTNEAESLDSASIQARDLFILMIG
jgi:hypothetical protein